MYLDNGYYYWFIPTLRKEGKMTENKELQIFKAMNRTYLGEKEKEVSDHTHKCKGCEEIVDDSDFNCGLELCCYCLDMMKEEEKEK